MTGYSEQYLRDKAEEAWRNSWTRYYHERTHLFYDWVSSHDPEKRLAHLPTPEEIARQYPNTNGWGTGMEDSTISAGVMMAMVCDRFDVTGDESLRQAAADIFAGMVLCSTLSTSGGLVLRSVSPIDGESYYIESSRDQYTHFARGFWRFAHSPLCTGEQRSAMARIITGLCQRLEQNVVPGETDYHICKEDGTPGMVDKMWQVDCHEAARLPMIYSIGWYLTGERHWWEMYRRYAWPAARASVRVPLQMRTPYALLQEQVSLLPLYALENEDMALKAAWLGAMEFVAGRIEASSWQCLNYKPLDATCLDMDWRHWPLHKAGTYQVPVFPEACRAEAAALREPAEGQLAQLLCPHKPISQDQLALLKQTLAQVDYGRTITYGLFYSQAAYWRAVKLDLLELP